MTEAQGKKVLVVDDEEDVREFLVAVLEDAGFSVEMAEDGEVALERVRANPPDLISLDLVMPRKSGIRFLYELRHDRNLSRIPVLILTAHAHDDLGRDDFRDVFAGKGLVHPGGYLEKPVDPDSYVRTVCEVMGVAASPAASGQGRKDLREEVDDLLQGADAEKLAAILGILKKDDAT